jgi:cell division transport system permease protein
MAIGDGARSLLRAWRSSALALAAIVSAVFVLGSFLVVSQAVDQAVARWSAAAELSVFLAEPPRDDQRAAVEQTLRGHPAVLDVRVVTPEEARQRFATTFPDLAPLLAGEAASLPASIEARLRPGAEVTEVTALADRLRQAPGVADVRVDQVLLQTVQRAARAGWLIAGILSGILVLAAALSIASVVRLSYVGRRDEVDILYLVGAPLSAIRGPFIAEGALQGALGTGLALLLLALVHGLVFRAYGDALAGLPVRFLPVWQVALVIAGGIAIGAAAGFAAVRSPRTDVLE